MRVEAVRFWSDSTKDMYILTLSQNGLDGYDWFQYADFNNADDLTNPGYNVTSFYCVPADQYAGWSDIKPS